MPSQKNIDALKQISEKLASSKAIILTDYSGLPMSDQNQLKNQAKETGNEYGVTKNNLVRLALEGRSKELAESFKQALEGPTATMFALGDAVDAAKILTKLAEANENLKIKMGLLLGSEGSVDQILTPNQIEALSKLPSKDQLIAKLLAQLNAPVQTLARLINSPMQYLVYALDAVKNKQA